MDNHEGNHERDCETVKKVLGDIMTGDLPDKLDERMENAVRSFRRNLPEHPYVRSVDRKSRIERFNEWFFGWNLAWSAGTILVFAVALHSLLFGGGNPSWADVAKQFKSLPFFHATVYAKDMSSAHAVQFEIWMGEGGRVRLRFGSQVIFAGKQGIVKTYNIYEKRVVTPHEEAVRVIEMLNAADTFSLETVIQTLTQDPTELRPVTSRVEGISEDLSVFDIISDNDSDNIRIWTLRESELPIQVQKRNHRTGESIDVLFSYLKEQPNSFFDPQQFEEELGNLNHNPNDILDAFRRN